jgi:hypothetical protein
MDKVIFKSQTCIYLAYVVLQPMEHNLLFLKMDDHDMHLFFLPLFQYISNTLSTKYFNIFLIHQYISNISKKKQNKLICKKTNIKWKRKIQQQSCKQKRGKA